MRRTKTNWPIRQWIAVCMAMYISSSCFSQSRIDSILGTLDPQKYAASIGEKARKMEDKLVQKSMKVLEGMQKQEEKIYKKLLSGKDSLLAKVKLAELNGQYTALKNKMKAPPILAKAKQYIPNLDSLNTSLKFLDQNGIGGKVKDALAKTGDLQERFQQAEEIKKFLRERKEKLKAQLEKLGMVKQLKQVNKKIFYYSMQLKECREILKDPKKIEKKVLELLAKNKWFQGFMRKNSMLAGLLGFPNDPSNASGQANLAGLQTRVQINNIIQQQIATGGPNAQQQLQQNLQSGQAQLNQLKNKIMNSGGGNEDIMPEGFQKNDQKTKPFLKRLEYEANIQSQKATNFYPNTSDIGLSIGFRPNNNSVVGVGASYKMGLGRGWNNIRLSHEGIGLRTYADLKLKGSFWISGGYEKNYKSAFTDFDELRNRSGWQTSGLLGLSKKYKVSKKHSGKLQLLWDFLSHRQMPRTQPIVFRIGFSLK